MVVWTHNAKSRLNQKGLTESKVLAAFNYPDNSTPGRIPGTTLYQKTLDSETVSLVTKQNERGEWIIITCWTSPSHAHPQKYKKLHYNRDNKSLIGKIIRDLKYLIGIK